jgi:hypothetical protein
MFLTGSGDKLCGSSSCYSSAQCWPFCLSSLSLPKVCPEIRSLLFPLLWCAYSPPPPLHCVHFQFLVYSDFFVVIVGHGVSLPWGLCWFISGVARGVLRDTCCSPVCLPNVSQAGLELASGHMGALLFFQFNVAWKSFLWARGSRCRSFDSP